MYQKRTNKQNSEDAVSPVVAVMLMLVVTIVIAALVAAFATGVMGDQKAAPVVTASVKLDTVNNITTFTFTSVSEPVALSDVELSLKSTKGEKLYTQTDVLGLSGSIVGGTNVVKLLALENGEGTNITGEPTIMAVLADPTLKKKYLALYTTNATGDNGNFNIYSGDGTELYSDVPSTHFIINSMVKIQGSTATAPYKGQYATCNPGYTFKKNENIMKEVPVEDLEAGDKVSVKLIYLPSNTVLFEKTVTIGV